MCVCVVFVFIYLEIASSHEESQSVNLLFLLRYVCFTKKLCIFALFTLSNCEIKIEFFVQINCQFS